MLRGWRALSCDLGLYSQSKIRYARGRIRCARCFEISAEHSPEIIPLTRSSTQPPIESGKAPTIGGRRSGQGKFAARSLDTSFTGLRWLTAKELKGFEIHPLLAPFQAARCRVADAAAFGTAAMTLEPGLWSENILVLDDTVPLQMRGILGMARSVGLPLGPECHAISIF